MNLDKANEQWKTLDHEQELLLEQIQDELDHHKNGVSTVSETARLISDVIENIKRIEYRKQRIEGMMEVLSNG